ncbi:thiamine phosphate synthase [Chryseobacterium sp. Chry.R1]|uniref:thiamine phosphate synthase n=1 Tax=Chryseobacterium sp. Chry.R1 TaxID=3139392 RepID=UPI0031F8E27F
MIIVISPENILINEAECVNKMFQDGLELFHIRKPFITEEEMIVFLDQIDASFRHRLVMHSYFDLAAEYGISRIHFREEDRINGLHPWRAKGSVISTSVHDIISFNALEPNWEYAFFSPFFSSISKPGYGEHSKVLERIGLRNNHDVKLIALGGIYEENMEIALRSGAEGLALLGGIWMNEQPVKAFNQCRNRMLEYNYQNR